MSKGAIRVDWYPINALAGMKFLTPMEELAYRRIIDLLYTEGGALPDDDETMAEQTRTFKDWKKVKAGLIRKEKISISDGQITNEKCTEVLTDIQQRSDAARASGKASGEKRRKLLPTKKERPLNDRSNGVDEKAPKTPTEIELSHLVNKSVQETNVSLTARESESEEFSDFVKAYPKAEGRNAAITEWNAAVEAGATPESILAGLASAKKVWAKEKREERWIKNAGTWLADRGWLDHAPDVAPVKPWDGPEPVRKAILAAIGPDAAKSCFEASEWDGEQIIPRTTWVFDKLRGVPGVKDMLAPVRKAA